MNRFVQSALEHRPVVVVLAALLAVAGFLSIQRIPIDAFPDVTNIQVTIISQAPTLSPLEMEQLVTYPIEQACAGLPHSTEVRSLSKFGLSMVTVVFEDGTDIYFARQLVMERMLSAREELPEQAVSSLGPISTGLGEVFQYTLESDQRDLMELRSLHDWVVRPILKTTPGSAGVDSFGGFVRQHHVVADPNALRTYGLTLNDLAEAVASSNGVVGGSYVERGAEQFVVRGDAWIRSAQDLRDTVVAYRNRVPVLLSQVAGVEDGEEIRQGAISESGDGERVAGIVLMLRGASGREVVAGIRDRLETVKGSLPSDVEIVPFYDRSELVATALGTVSKALIQGAFLVTLVLLFFMGRLRSAVLVALQLPLAALATFFAMRTVGLSANLMTLSGIAIAIGMLCDGAIVLVENAARLMAQAKTSYQEGGALPPHFRRDVIEKATIEVARPVFFGVAVIVVVFLPIATLQGIEGKTFAPLAYTISLALVASLILTFTVIPVLASWILKPGGSYFGTGLRHPADVARKLYRPILARALEHPWALIAAVVILAVIAGLMVPTLGTEFLPSMDEGSIVVQPFQLPSVSLEESLRNVQRIEQTIMELPEVERVVSRTGRSDISSDPMGVGESDIYVLLKDRDEWQTASTKAGLVTALRERLDNFPGVEFGYTQPIQMRVDELISGVKSQIAVKIFGDDLEQLATLADQAASLLAAIEGAVDVKSEPIEGLGYLEIRMDRQRLARFGIQVEQVQSIIETAIAGKVVTRVPEGDRRIGVVVRLPRDFVEQVDNLLTLPLSTPSGERVELGEVASIELTEGPAQVSREDGKRRVVIELNLDGRDIGGFVREAREVLDQNLSLPTGWYITWGGQFQQQQRAMARLRVMVPLALVLIFVLLYLNFRRVTPVLLILINIPFALVGGVFGLKLSGMYLSVSASVGFISLFGIAVLNGLVMIEFFQKLERDGKGRLNAILEGAELRLRPILMTAATTALGLMPLVWARGVGSEVQRPLAIVVVSGVVTSTLLTLFVLPVLYQWFGGNAARSSD